jgi:chemotaxis protein CheD
MNKKRPTSPERYSMNRKQAVNDVFIFPGGVFFGDQHSRIHTLLGSCVSIVFWHPGLLMGGMSHFMLPSRNRQTQTLDGRYADEAITLLMQHIDDVGAPREQYQVKVFGGGDMFGYKANGRNFINIGIKNIRAARSLIRMHGFQITSEHLGGDGHRVVMFDICSGEVNIKYVPGREPLTAMNPSRTTDHNITYIRGNAANTGAESDSSRSYVSNTDYSGRIL